jgi:hypothetical protein
MKNSSDSDTTESKNPTQDNPNITLPGVVEKILKPLAASAPEKAQIAIQGADHLYREIRIDNALKDSSGEEVKLKPGAEVNAIIEAPQDSVEKKTA